MVFFKDDKTCLNRGAQPTYKPYLTPSAASSSLWGSQGSENLESWEQQHRSPATRFPDLWGALWSRECSPAGGNTGPPGPILVCRAQSWYIGWWGSLCSNPGTRAKSLYVEMVLKGPVLACRAWSWHLGPYGSDTGPQGLILILRGSVGPDPGTQMPVQPTY